MRRNIITYFAIAGAIILSNCTASETTDEAAAPNLLGFETQSESGLDEFWNVKPEGVVELDIDEVYEGAVSARLERTPQTEGEFSSLGFEVPVSDPGGVVTLRAAIKATDFVGMASLWARQDGVAGRVAYTNLRERSVRSDQDWTVHELEAEIDPRARSLSVGVFFAGTGRVHVDAFELLLNGEPVEVDVGADDKSEVSDEAFEFASGSGVQLSGLSPVQLDNVSTFVKVWGFLKYHHPAIAGGDVDWDIVFLRVLPEVLDLQNASDRNDWLAEWVDDLGPINPCDPCASPLDESALAPRYQWIGNEAELGGALVEKLETIRANRFSGSEQHYVKSGQSGQAEFQNELTYSVLEETDSGFRLLAAARYWNMIEYWFPYRDIIDEDWHTALNRALTEVAQSQSELEYQIAMVHLIAAVQDTHAKLNSHLQILPPVGTCDLPIHIRFIENAPTIVAFQSELATAQPFAIGDIIERIDGRATSDLLAEMRPLYAASNTAVQNRDIASNLTRGACGPTQIEVDRDGALLEFESQRVRGALKNALSHSRDLPGETVQVLDGNIGYIKLSSVTQQDVPVYVETIRETDGLILDLRNYPNDNVMYALSRWFTEESTEFAVMTAPNFETPGEFEWVNVPPIPTVDADQRLAMPIAILVDEVTQSSGEFTAMAFRSLPNAIVVGSQTAGADGNMSRIALPGGLHTTVSGMGVFYPDRTPTQRIGIVPDFTVLPTREGVIEGRDEVLDWALAVLLGKDVGAQ